MTDVVERLRKPNAFDEYRDPIKLEAADEIERLRNALKAIAAIGDSKSQLTIANDALEGK